MANLFIILGVVFLIAGFLMTFSKSSGDKENKNELPVSENVLSPSRNIPSASTSTPLRSNGISSDNFEENKLKGDAFEKYVVKRFNRKFFNVIEWRSDKYVDGIYAVSNHFPDLELLFRAGNIKDSFAIECKWRKDYYRNGIEWASDYQIENYIKYAKEISIPVFIVLGVGGEPDNPGELFIIPLDSVESNVISKAKLFSYKKYKKDFYWDTSQKILK